MPPPGDIIVVDDDESVREAAGEYLQKHGYRVRTADGGEALDRALVEAPADLVILDLMMPGEDGLAICRRLAADGPPVLMVSALGDTMDRVVGLELGAADYLPKPYDPRELLARVRAVLRRRGPDEPANRLVFLFDGWRFDADAGRLQGPDGAPVDLTPGEMLLLRAFLERPGLLLGRDRLLELTKGPDAEPFDRAIDLAVSRLRRKLEPGGGRAMIETVRGIGYRFEPRVRRA
ncbi:MAG TPA: response regulator transcription factor [Allosphingosinicella sp.]|nr:response regulator transcription factor [Allosphingosinicella sp.]